MHLLKRCEAAIHKQSSDDKAQYAYEFLYVAAIDAMDSMGAYDHPANFKDRDKGCEMKIDGSKMRIRSSSRNRPDNLHYLADTDRC
ncbi:hypothetical protein ASE07_26690 [Noviherbaspirillum sp. Root189]|nr:hypothetical protein ASE07_26690 [Noviherbaspirillum sp. Root189]